MGSTGKMPRSNLKASHQAVAMVGDSLVVGHAWARKSLENMDESLIFGCDLRKVCEEWNL
jgi:hypothetical protein